MTTLRTAAQQALEALEYDNPAGRAATITALKAALAQQAEPTGKQSLQVEPAQEPAAWMESTHGAIRANPNYKCTFPSQLLHWQIPLYTAPPRCPNCASLEAQNTELDRKLAEMERAHGMLARSAAAAIRARGEQL